MSTKSANTESRPIEFTKMHGLGNDFMVVDNTAGDVRLSNERIRQLSDRQFGVGFDQLLVVEPASVADAEFDYRIYNADGGEVEHCGNGARCFAVFIRDRGMTSKDSIRVNTSAGVITLRLQTAERVTVDMGIPTFVPDQIPFLAESVEPVYVLDAGDQQLEVSTVAIGNPHVVILVDDVSTAPVATLGPLIEFHPRFPKRVNVGFMQIVDRGQINLRVYERGVGETQACGTGACAAVAIGVNRDLLDASVVVNLMGGKLDVFWPGINSDVEMTGPCTTVFEGQTRM